MIGPGEAMTHDAAIRTLAAERYQLGEMSDAERDAFEAHYFECEECAGQVRVGELLRDGARQGWSAPAVTAASSTPTAHAAPLRFAPRPPRRWYASPLLPWGLAATLALAVGYQSRRPAAQPAASLQALSPLTLRATARGTEAVVPVPPAGAVTFALDVDPQGAGELAYELHGPDDRVVARGNAAPPAGGAPLLLLVARENLLPSGAYRIVVRDAAAGRDLGDYRFSTTAQ